MSKPITEQSRAVTFVKNVEEMKGHLHSSVHWKRQGNLQQAKKHAKHPGEGYWNLIGPAVEKADSEFATKLKTTLDELPSKAESMNASAYATYVNETVYPMLDKAVNKTVTTEARSGLAFDGAVVNALLTRIDDEYGVAMADNGSVQKLGEYWDARGFIVRVEARYTAEIKPELSSENAEELQEFVDTIERKIENKAAPSEVTPAIENTRLEISEYTGAGKPITEQSRAVTFVKNVEEIKGHLHSSVYWKRQGNLQQAKKHAKHPSEGYWNLIGPAVEKADSEFATKLKSTLDSLPSKAESMSASEYATYVNETVGHMLHEAVEKTVKEDARSGLKFHGEVVNALLKRTNDEYSVAMADDGSVKKLGEYWDARGFIVRIEARYKAEIKPELSSENAEEVQEFVDTIERKIENKAAPSEVSSAIENTRAEISEYTGAGESGEGESGESGSSQAQAIDAIKSNLDEVVEKYEQGNSAQAKRLITQTYLTRFEGLEGPLIEQRPELVEELELAFNEELPGLIENNASVSKVRKKVQSMKSKLDTAKQVLASAEEEQVVVEDTPTTTTSGPATTTKSGAPDTGTSTNTTAKTTSGSGPGFGPVVALLALVALGLLAGRRRTN